jgi:N-acetylglucosaminyldiphosphoundecaprenol N-acetyl-beta-D-mannosaminyltransferase
MDYEKINIRGLLVDRISYADLQNIITAAVKHNNKTFITYANASTINNIWSNKKLRDKLNIFDVIHPDGIGIYIASKILYGTGGFRGRLSGSDFYTVLINDAEQNKWKLFFFGHNDETLKKIKIRRPMLNLCGTENGFNYDDTEVLTRINNTSPDILVIGLSFPRQEEWLLKYKDEISAKVCICVGDGIKVFAGNKIRGPKFIRAMGFEWLVRLLANPLKYFKRYIIGNPLFLVRIISLKFRKFMQ